MTAGSNFYDRRERDHLRYYPGIGGSSTINSASQPRPASTGKARLGLEQVSFHNARRALSAERARPYVEARDYDRRDIESASTSSDSTKTTPSSKARDLRRQLDEALQASKEIRRTHEKLGSELKTFKQRFYKKNDEIEDQAMRVIGSRTGGATNYSRGAN
jgi:hypothetical protein